MENKAFNHSNLSKQISFMREFQITSDALLENARTIKDTIKNNENLLSDVCMVNIADDVLKLQQLCNEIILLLG